MLNIKNNFTIFLFVITVLLIAGFVVANSHIARRHIEITENQVHDDLLHLANHLTFNLYNDIQVIKGLPALIAINPALSQQDFAIVAKKMFAGQSHLKNIALAPNLINKYIYPVKGNEATLDIDFRAVPAQIRAINRAIASKQLILAGPEKLLQGGTGLIARMPVFINDANDHEFFWGIVSAVIDTDKLYQQSGFFDAALPIDIAIRGEDGLGKNGGIFFGDPSLFDQKHISSIITVPNGAWQIVARPKGGWQALPEDIWLTRLYLVGAALILFFIFFFYLKASMKASLANLKFKRLIEKSPIPYVLTNSKQEITFLNVAFIKTFGYTIKDIPTKAAWVVKAYPDQTYRQKVVVMWADYLEKFKVSSGTVSPIEVNIQSKHETMHTALISLSESMGEDGSEYTIVVYDITERKLAEEQHKIAKQQLENVIEAAQLGYWDWNYQTGENIVNQRWLAMLGLPQQKLTSTFKDWQDLVHPDDQQSAIKIIQEKIQQDEAYVIEFRMKHADGHWVWIQGSGAVVEYEEHTHKPLRLCGTHQDITVRKKNEAQQMLSARVFSGAHEGILITNANNKIVDVNPAYCNITGYDREDVIGKNPSILNSGRQSKAFYSEMWQTLKQHDHWQGEMWNRKKGGELYIEFLSISKLLDVNGKIINYIGIFTDVTEHRQQQEKLNLIAHYDLLTSLPNRVLFADRFHQAIAHSKRTQTYLTVCFLDIDNFKVVNDNYGHEVGDKLLVQVAARIKANLKEDDTVSRQGGDEFALLLNDIESYEHSKLILDRLHRALAVPYHVDGHDHKISVSTGVTLFPTDNGDIDTLLRHADQAMYQAKQAGRNRYQLFDTQDDQETVNKHLRLAEIERGLSNNEFTLYYQPKVNMVTGEVFGVEALIRWVHPEQGLIPPLSFLPIIDGTDIEIMVGDWVINQALMQLQSWRQQGITLEVSVNIASHHLRSEQFLTQFSAALAEYPTANAHSLQLEILESSALGDLDAISNIIKTVQDELGVSVALDDFGTSYSSLTHLRNLSANTLKIDQSFVRDMLEDPSDYAIIDGVIGLADAFNLRVIAEGVEASEHGLMLIMMGCEQAQGYGIAKPMPADEVTDWLGNYQPNQQWIHLSKQQLTNKENKVALFQLAAQHWVNRFITKLESPVDEGKAWPLMLGENGHCGKWLKREQQDLLFVREGLDLLQEAFEEFQQTAQNLYDRYQSDDIEQARAGIAEFQNVFDKVLQNSKMLLI